MGAFVCALKTRSRAVLGLAIAVVVGALFAPAAVAVAHAIERRRDAHLGGRYREHVFDDVTVKVRVPYRTAVSANGHRTTLFLDVYQPSGDRAAGRPVVIWVHGGGFSSGLRSAMASYATDFAQRGYVAIDIDYRLRPDLKWFEDDRRPAASDAYDDTAAAVAWVRKHARSLRVDPDRIFVGGFSAGGVVAFAMAYPPAGKAPAGIAGAIVLAGCGDGPAAPGAPPVVAFQGTDDVFVSWKAANDTCARARAARDRCTLVTLPKRGHDIDTVDLTRISDNAARFAADLVGGRK
jgi:acetyl esterase/lipase